MENSEGSQGHNNSSSVEENEEKDGTSCWWWSPRQNSLLVSFCKETSIHGVIFMGQEKRHILERIFWVIAFCLSIGTAVFLIYGLWIRYLRVPVIVTFQASEQDVNTIPFPAVTICNINTVPKSKVDQLQRIVQDLKSTEEARAQAKKGLGFVRNICNSQQSFARNMGFAFMRGSLMRNYSSGAQNDVLDDDSRIGMTDFLFENTDQCGDLIRLCMFEGKKRDCSKIFKPIITDSGKCCTFNILPIPFLIRNPKSGNNMNGSIYDNPVLGSLGEKHWPPDELNEWKKWDYDDGFVLPWNPRLRRPWQQKRAGLRYGLSILVDPNTEEYFCPASDSEGLRYILHTPLEMPHVMEFSSVAHMGKEILIKVHPDVTNADSNIRGIEPDKRLCYFGEENPLRLFRPYTLGNCLDECVATHVLDKCNCSSPYMPIDDEVSICDAAPESSDYRCIESAWLDVQADIWNLCDCDSLCEDIAYNYETTIAKLQNASKLWGDPNPSFCPNGPPHWLKNKMSIIHIFFGADSTVPKLRKRLYGTTDLLANTGGILGLCLGFSILSGVEMVYFLTLRSLCAYCRKRILKRKARKQQQKKGNCNFIYKMCSLKRTVKVINLNPNVTPVYPHDAAFAAARGSLNGYQRKDE